MEISDKKKKTERRIVVTSAIIFIIISILSFFIGKKDEEKNLSIITETQEKVTQLVEQNKNLSTIKENQDTLIDNVKKALLTRNIILDEKERKIIFNHYTNIATYPFIQSTGSGDIHANNNVFDLNIIQPKK